MNFIGFLAVVGLIYFVAYQIVGMVKDAKKRKEIKQKQAEQSEVTIEDVQDK